MIPPGFAARLAGLLLAVAVGLLLAVEFVALPWVVAGPSMRPTLREGERVLVDVWSYRHRPPRVGEVVLLEGPGGSRLVKRVAPLPAGAAPGPGLWGEGEPGPAVWVLGDNPAVSADSRRFGAVPAGRVRGRVVVRVWPPARAGRVR